MWTAQFVSEVMEFKIFQRREMMKILIKCEKDLQEIENTPSFIFNLGTKTAHLLQYKDIIHLIESL